MTRYFSTLCVTICLRFSLSYMLYSHFFCWEKRQKNTMDEWVFDKYLLDTLESDEPLRDDIKVALSPGGPLNYDLFNDVIPPLFLTCMAGHLVAIQWLLDQGVDPNECNAQGQIPLCRVVYATYGLKMGQIPRRVQCIRALMAHGSSFMGPDMIHVLDYAHGKPELVRALVWHGAFSTRGWGPTPLTNELKAQIDHCRSTAVLTAGLLRRALGRDVAQFFARVIWSYRV